MVLLGPELADREDDGLARGWVEHELLQVRGVAGRVHEPGLLRPWKPQRVDVVLDATRKMHTIERDREGAASTSDGDDGEGIQRNRSPSSAVQSKVVQCRAGDVRRTFVHDELAIGTSTREPIQP